MATQYGFKLWEVSVHKGWGRTAEDYSKAQLKSGDAATVFQDHVLAVAASIKNKTRTEVLRYRPVELAEDISGEREDTTPSMRLIDCGSGNRQLQFSFRFGRRGAYDIAIAADETDDAPLDDKASSNLYRARLYLPTKGDKAVLAAEARNATCPGTELLRLLGVTSMEQDNGLDEGSRLGWWRFMPKSVTDTDQLKAFIRGGHANGIRLEKESISASGVRKRNVVTVHQNYVPLSKHDQARILGGSWFGLTRKQLDITSKGPSGKNDLEKLASLVELPVKASDFNDGGLDWEGPDGNTQFVKPGHAREVFVYPVGKRGNRPTDSELWGAVEERIRALQKKRKWNTQL